MNAPESFERELGPLPAVVNLSAQANEGCDLILFFAQSQRDLTKNFAKLAARLQPNGTLWVTWPKKASGLATDLSSQSVHKIGLYAGLVDVKICSVTEIWSRLKFVIRLKDRPRH